MIANELNRRAFLKVSAEAGAGLLIAVQLPWPDELAGAAMPADLQPSVYVRIDTDGLVWVVVDKCELGQGELTALPMILADELEADWSKVRPVHIPPDPSTWVRNISTGGSTGVRTTWEPLRKAGATAREMLRAAAAAEWNVPVEECRAANGSVEHEKSARRLGYGGLVTRAAALPVPENPPLKPASEFRIIGKGKARLDLPEKVNGSLEYGSDVVLPGMLYAVVARPPAFGAKFVSVDDAAARAVAGVVDVLTVPQGVAVVARSTWAALQGREALRVTWDSSASKGISSEAYFEEFRALVRTPGESIRNEGDVDAALAAAPTRVEGEYRAPFLDHAVMEPLNATAHVHDGKVELWVPTQVPTAAQQTAAEVAGVQPGDVILHVPLVGSGFGRRLATDDTALAVEVAKRVSAPVRVWWTREDTIRNGTYRPLSHHLLQAGLDRKGAPVAWLYRGAGTGPRGLVASGADNPGYTIPNLRAEYHEKRTPVPVGPLRSVAYTHMGWVLESFVDELAHAAGQDPYEYRRAHMPEGKLRDCLDLAAAESGWRRRRPAGWFHGIAAVSSFSSHCAQVAEVTVAESGQVRVHRIVCAVHVGQVVQPDNIRSQVEGAVAIALGFTLKHELTIEDGVVQQTNFGDYPLLRMDEMPEVQVFVVPSDEPPTGIGEPPLPPVAAAVCNAIFAATGKRIRRLPVRATELRRT